MVRITFARLPIIAVVLLSFALAGMSFAQSGTSTISLNPTTITLHAGQSGTSAYTVTLVNGSAGSTCLFIPNNNELQAPAINITASIYPDSGTPPFSGTLSIFTSRNSAPGTYAVRLAAGCADGLGGKPGAQVNLTILAPVATTSIAPTTTVTSHSTSAPTTAPSTVPTTPTTTMPYTPTSSSFYALLAIIIIIIVIIIIVVAVWWYRR